MQAVRSKQLARRAAPTLRIRPAERRRILGGGYRLRRLATMGERQPGGKLVGGFFRCLAVERHHRRGYASRAAELGTPTVTDGRYLDVVRTPTDSFFEMMNDHVGDVTGRASNEGDFTRLSRGIKRNRSRRRRP